MEQRGRMPESLIRSDRLRSIPALFQCSHILRAWEFMNILQTAFSEVNTDYFAISPSNERCQTMSQKENKFAIVLEFPWEEHYLLQCFHSNRG